MVPYNTQVLTVLRQKPDLRQRFYPQCASCSSKQGAALRAGKTTALVMHQVPVGPPQLLAAVLVGCHPYCTFLSSGPGGGFSIASRRSTGVSSIGLTLPLPPFISRRRTTASARPTTSTDLSAQAHPLVVLNTVNADNADGDSPNQEVVASGAGFAGFRRGGYKVVASASSDDLLATAASAATSDSVADVPEEYYLPPPVDAAFVGALAGGAEAVVATPVGKVASVVEAYTTAALEAGQQAAAAAAVGGKGPSPTAKGPSPTGKGPSPPKAPLGFATL